MAFTNILDKYSKESTIKVFIDTFDSPIGQIVVAADDKFVYMVSFVDFKNFEKNVKAISEELSCHFAKENNTVILKLQAEFSDYFKGQLKKFTVPIKTIGSEFQKEVWSQLLDLPYGSTHTYGELAKSMGRPGSHARAIGSACGANAHLILIPCHRLVASGSKGGYNSGVDRKEWLIDHEQKHSK